MSRSTIFVSLLVLLAVAGCGPTPLQAPSSPAFAPTPYEPTLQPSPVGLPTPSPLPPPTATATALPTPTSPPAAPPYGPTETNTPTNTPTVQPTLMQVRVSETTVTPNQLSWKAGEFVKLMLDDMGNSPFEFQVQNLTADNVVPDESLAGPVPEDQKSTVDSDASNGTVHLFAMPQGNASVSIMASKAGSYPFTVKIAGKTLTGTITIQ